MIEDIICEIVQCLADCSIEWNNQSMVHRIASLFGVPSTVIADLWNCIEASFGNDKPGAKPKHLLWGLLFLKLYAISEELDCLIVGWPHSGTSQKWSLYFVRKIFDLQADVIMWENRFILQQQFATTGKYHLPRT